jgi:hypothetical protein
MAAVAGTTSIVWYGSGLPSLVSGEGAVSGGLGTGCLPLTSPANRWHRLIETMVLASAVLLADGISSWPKGRDCGDQGPAESGHIGLHGPSLSGDTNSDGYGAA